MTARSHSFVGIIFLACCIVTTTASAMQVKPNAANTDNSKNLDDDAVIASDDHAIAIFSEDLDIALETSGILRQLNVSEGDLIGQQQILGSLNAERAKLEFELATLQLELAEEKTRQAADEAFAKATIEIAEKNIQRAKSASGAIAPSELDQYHFEKTRGDLALQQATEDRMLSVLEAKTAAAHKNVAEHDLDLHIVKSPIQGVVVQLYHRPGEFLQVGEPLLRIVKNDVMRISAAINLLQAEQVEKGCLVRFRPSHWPASKQAPSFTGKIIFVSPETFGEIRTVKILAEVQAPDRNLKAKVDGRLEIFAKQ